MATAIPKITDQFHSVSQIGWYGSAFFLTVASFTSPWGKLFKYFPLKWTYLASIFIFELGSLICGMCCVCPKVGYIYLLITSSSRFPEQYLFDCWACHCWSRCCRCCFRGVHFGCFPRSARKAASISRHHWRLLRYFSSYWASTWRRVYREALLAMVLLYVRLFPTHKQPS